MLCFSEKLVVRNVRCDIDVVIVDKNDPVFVGGATEDVSYRRFFWVMFVDGVDNSTESSNINVSGNGNVVASVSGDRNNVVIGGVSVSSNTRRHGGKVTIGVHEGTSVDIEGCADVKIGDIKANLHVKNDNGEVIAGSVKKLSISLFGHGNVSIGEARGNASIKLVGKGVATICSGNIDYLKIISNAGTFNNWIRGDLCDIHHIGWSG